MLTSLFEKGAQRLLEWASKVDDRKVKKNVKALRKANPEAGPDELIQALIKAKAQRTATVGVVTSVAGAVPIIGTAVSLTAGMAADLSATITSQAELVLEIAEVLGVELDKKEKREAVFVVMGLGAGMQQMGTRVSKDLLSKLGQRYAKRWVGKVIPFAGILAAGGINYISTYLIGKRAKIYFTQGEDHMGNWQQSLQHITEFDKDQLAQWMQQNKESVNTQLVNLGKNLQEWAEETSEKWWPAKTGKPVTGDDTVITVEAVEDKSFNVETSQKEEV